MSETREQETTNKAPAPSPDGEPKKPLSRKEYIDRWFEVVTAIMLGVVALATAWSGYQATRWDGEQAANYAQASALRVDSTRDSTLAGQFRLYDLEMTNNWLNAHYQGNNKLADIFEKRFRPEFLPVFKAWLALDPFNNPNAPPGPLFMPQYKISLQEQADKLEAQAANAFTTGQADNQQSDNYVLNTVFLATVLFLTAIAERFDWNWVRAVILIFALGMLIFGIYHLLIYPII